ncbi:MAG: HpaII family restriction endonuclease [Promethearchaeota archaeon]
MISGNKGEWSEIYVFFKLLAEGKLYAADGELKKKKAIYYPIIKIIREDIDGKWEYEHQSKINIINGSTKEKICEIPIREFANKASELLNDINASDKSSFNIEEIERFMNEIHVKSLKSGSGNKKDITIMVHDIFTGFEPILGFSIKSRLGSPSTLLNAGKTTNFIYKINNVELDNTQINEINNINPKQKKIRQRVKKIEDLGGKFEFMRLENENFSLNLQLIDSYLPLILSEMLLQFSKGRGNTLKELTELIKKINPCKFNLKYKHPFYEYRIKNLLTDIALGMMPSKTWNGYYDATGGYIIVREDGEVLCYHVYNMNDFQDYLFKNTRFESASTSRHQYAKVYRSVDGKLLFKLNLQIRFIK